MAQLTGRRRHRKNWAGKLILQVEELVAVNYDPNDFRDCRTWDQLSKTARWRDATFDDLFTSADEPKQQTPPNQGSGVSFAWGEPPELEGLPGLRAYTYDQFSADCDRLR